jgi:CheY-like chemotaxis protein
MVGLKISKDLAKILSHEFKYNYCDGVSEFVLVLVTNHLRNYFDPVSPNSAFRSSVSSKMQDTKMISFKGNNQILRENSDPGESPDIRIINSFKENQSVNLEREEEDFFCIAVVDDQNLIRNNIKNQVIKICEMIRLKCRILEGSDGIDIINLVINDKDDKIKLILTDESMNYLNGSDAMKIIRNLELNQKVNRKFFVSITCFEDDYYKQKILNAGADLILSKPTSDDVIKQIIFKAFNIGSSFN